MHCYAYELMQKKNIYLQSLPRVLLSSALWRCGYWSASFLRAACAHTINAFHRSLHVRLVLFEAVHSHRHGHQRPVVAFQHLRHRISDAHRELVFFVLLELAKRPRPEPRGGCSRCRSPSRKPGEPAESSDMLGLGASDRHFSCSSVIFR